MAAPRFLIIGQGLAGTILSYELLLRGIPHKVLDNHHKHAATKAAAGIINPITGRRYVKSWMIDQLLPVAKEKYSGLEKLLNTKLVTDSNILRALGNLQEENAWNEATSRPGYENYVTTPQLEEYSTVVNQSSAYGEITQGMRVTVSTLIEHYRLWLIEQGNYVAANFDSTEYNYDAPVYSYDGTDYEAIIFCDGYRSIYNPLFQALPFQPAKGQSFMVSVNENLPTKLLRDKIFIAPTSTNEFWTGGGYFWKEFSEATSKSFYSDWTSKLEALLKVPFTILSHKAGVRPSVKGRRPMIGQHHKYDKVFLFNGMGTKGTSLAPYWAQEFVDLLIEGKPISEEVNLNRFVTN